jgi:hypothetical protein
LGLRGTFNAMAPDTLILEVEYYVRKSTPGFTSSTICLKVGLYISSVLSWVSGAYGSVLWRLGKLDSALLWGSETILHILGLVWEDCMSICLQDRHFEIT